MSEPKVLNFLITSLLLMTALMLAWTFMYISKIETSSNINIPIVSAFNA